MSAETAASCLWEACLQLANASWPSQETHASRHSTRKQLPNCRVACMRSHPPCFAMACNVCGALADAKQTGVAQEAVNKAAKTVGGMTAQEARMILEVDPNATWLEVTKVRHSSSCCCACTTACVLPASSVWQLHVLRALQLWLQLRQRLCRALFITVCGLCVTPFRCNRPILASWHHGSMVHLTCTMQMPAPTPAAACALPLLPAALQAHV